MMKKMKIVGLHVFVAQLKFFYFFLKRLPSKEQVVFISRQTKKPSVDFEMIIRQLNMEHVPVVVLCKQMEPGLRGAASYYGHIFKQMFVMARSRVCVIDTYIIPVSVLKHKPDLKVVQIWHAIGKIKKSGYQTLDKNGGRDATISHALKMHQNYDYIIAGAPYWNPFYCQSFNVSEEKLKNFGLPRMDYLLDNAERLKSEIRQKYPVLDNGKQTIIYAPTFRRTRAVDVQAFVENFDYDQFNLIVKLHPHDAHRADLPSRRVQIMEEYTTTQLLPLADYLVTDYSSIAFEAALINLKTFFFVSDYEQYMAENGLNLDLKQAVPSIVTHNSQEINLALASGSYDFQTFGRFKEMVLPKEVGQATEKIVSLIKEIL